MEPTRVALVALAFALAVQTAPRLVSACSFEPVDEHAIEPAEQAVDTVPPTTPALSYSVSRRPPSGDCDGATDSCEGAGRIGIQVDSVSDDRTLPANMGYLLRYAGSERDGVSVPEPAVRADETGTIWLNFSDRGQRIDLRLEVLAVDLAGNRSAPAELRVSDSSVDDGCAAAGRLGGGVGPVLLALAWLGWRARRSRRRP